MDHIRPSIAQMKFGPLFLCMERSPFSHSALPLPLHIAKGSSPPAVRCIHLLCHNKLLRRQCMHCAADGGKDVQPRVAVEVPVLKTRVAGW